MFRALFVTLLCAFSLSALAQTCDQTLTLTVAQGDAVKIVNTLVYKDLDAAEVKPKMDFRQGKMLKVASKEADKPSGSYTVTLAAFDSCGGKTEPGVFGGVTAEGVKRLFKAGTDTELAIDFSPQGKRKWGK